jgi:hypothetical protein
MLYGKLYATRPKMRWLDDVSKDLRKMGINEWRDRARAREAYCKGGQGPPWAVTPLKNKLVFLTSLHCTLSYTHNSDASTQDHIEDFVSQL